MDSVQCSNQIPYIGISSLQLLNNDSMVQRRISLVTTDTQNADIVESHKNDPLSKPAVVIAKDIGIRRQTVICCWKREAIKPCRLTVRSFFNGDI